MGEDMVVTDNEQKGRQIILFLVGLTLLGLVFILIYSLKLLSSRSDNEFTFLMNALALGGLIAGGAFAFGGLIGFMFGIPKVLQSTDVGDATTFLHNDNLVQISDWLTKIIVGVGLVEIKSFAPYLWKIANYLNNGFAKDSSSSVFIVSEIFYYVTIGFLLSYIWTRIYFKNILAKADLELLDSLKKENEEKDFKLDEQGKELARVSDEKEEIIEQVKEVFKETSGGISALGKQLNQSYVEDPNKNKFGGKSDANGRKITAEVVPLIRERKFLKIGLFAVNLNVSGTGENFIPENTEVVFHLHPTFKDSPRIVLVKNGKAQLKLLAYGAFTVGVEIKESIETRLELDLASDEVDAADEFKTR